MYNFIDLCCGFGSMTKAFEKTGAFHCVLAADIDDNMKNYFNYLFKVRRPLGSIMEKETLNVIMNTEFDVLVAGISNLNEEVFFQILEILEEKQPKAFVLELSLNTIDFSYCKSVDVFCKQHEYHFVGYEQGVDNITLDLYDFGIPEHCKKIYCVCIKKEWCRTDDPVFLQLNKKHDFNCYEYTKFDPDNHIEQIRGIDWGFHDFKFLTGTPDENKKTIIEGASPLPMVASVALDLMTCLKG